MLTLCIIFFFVALSSLCFNKWIGQRTRSTDIFFSNSFSDSLSSLALHSTCCTVLWKRWDKYGTRFFQVSAPLGSLRKWRMRAERQAHESEVLAIERAATHESDLIIKVRSTWRSQREHHLFLFNI